MIWSEKKTNQHMIYVQHICNVISCSRWAYISHMNITDSFNKKSVTSLKSLQKPVDKLKMGDYKSNLGYGRLTLSRS